MNTQTHFVLAAAFAGALAVAPSAFAQDQKFFFETTPNFASCGDESYARAMKDGVTLGFSQNPPEAIFDETTKQASGIDWDINKGALDWLGIKTIKTEWMPWASQVPALLSKRTDVIAGNIHVNPERVKVITFTGPAYWYGPVLIVSKGNPLGIKSYDDLKGKKVGTISGSAADFYARKIGVNTTAFKTEIEELQSLNQGRLEAVVEDDLVYLEFAKTNQKHNLEPLWSVATPEEMINGGGYGMARFALRKEDCSLRMAYTYALSEMRANGMISAILKKYGLGDRNLSMYKLNP